MEKKKQILILILFLIATVLIGALIFLDFEKKPQIRTDITELYSSFTDYMKEKVDSHLRYLGCEPTQYYEKESNICFVCDKAHPCFGYGLVHRAEGEKMNIMESFLSETAELEVEFVDFLWSGLASDFNCQKAEKDHLDCDMINFESKPISNTLKYQNVKLKIKEGINFQDFARRFCELRSEGYLEEITDLESDPSFVSGARCKEASVFLKDDGEIIILRF